MAVSVSRLADVPQFDAHVAHIGWREWRDSFMHESGFESAEDVEAWYMQKRDTFFIAHAENRFLGMISVDTHSDLPSLYPDDDDRVWLADLYVAEDVRGRGIARLLSKRSAHFVVRGVPGDVLQQVWIRHVAAAHVSG